MRSDSESIDESDGMDEANLKIPTQPNPAFPNYSARESAEVGSEDMCEHGMNARAVLMVAERYLVVSINK